MKTREQVDIEQTHTPVINNLDNSSETVDEFAMGEEDQTTDFDEAPLRDLDVDICHRWPVAANERQCEIQRESYRYLDSTYRLNGTVRTIRIGPHST